MVRPQDAWIASEPRLGAVVATVARRSLRRPLLTFGLAIAFTALVVIQRVRAVPTYVATLYFHMIENDLQDAASAPRPPANVRAYIGDVALNRTQLVRVMKKYGISTKLLARDPQAAIDSLREQIEVTVTHNYFIWARDPGDPPRMADITLSFMIGDPGLATSVVHELGDIILETQAAARAERLRQVREITNAHLASARDDLRRLQRRLDALWLESGEVTAGMDLIAVPVEIATVQQELRLAVDRVQKLEKRASASALAERAENEKLGLQFHLVDQDLSVRTPPLTMLEVALLALAILAVALGIFLGVVGGFDDRIHRIADLEARRVPVFGAFARFAGDARGSYRDRTRRRWANRV